MREKRFKYIVTKGDLTLGREHTMQYVDDVHLKPIQFFFFFYQCNSNKFNLINIVDQKNQNCVESLWKDKLT